VTFNFENSYWKTPTVRLRAIEPADWEVYFSFNQDDDMARRLDEIPLPRSQEAVRRWAEKEATKKPEDDNFRFVIERQDGVAIGDVTTHHCNRRVGTFSYGVAVHRDHRGKRFATDALTLVLRYYFQELRYQKVTVEIYSFNEGSIHLQEKLRFQREGQIRRMGYTDGKFFDHLIYGLTAEEFLAG